MADSGRACARAAPGDGARDDHHLRCLSVVRDHRPRVTWARDRRIAVSATGGRHPGLRRWIYVYDPTALHHIIVKDQYIYEEAAWFLK